MFHLLNVELDQPFRSMGGIFFVANEAIKEYRREIFSQIEQ